MRFAIVLLIVVASFAVAGPALAMSEGMCSALGTASGNVSGHAGGVIGGVVSQNCNNSSPANPVVASPEPLGALIVGLGLLGARLLVRRG